MSKKVFYCIFAILVVWNLWSLVYSPVVWFDEVYFASVTHSFITGNGMAIELDHSEPCVLYGPIYFLLTGLFTKVLGFGIFTFRLVNLLFAFLCMFSLGKMLKMLNVKDGLNYFCQLLLLTDAMFVSNAHSGRMEFVALFFVLQAYVIYLGDRKEIIKATAIPVLLIAAMLTTPRILFVAFPIALIQFVKFVKKQRWLLSAIYVTIPICIYGLWIYYAYGSVTDMLASFTKHSDSQGASLANHFFSGNWNIKPYHYLMVFAAICSAVLCAHKKKLNQLWAFIFPILFFYCFVFDLGMYAVIILPFYFVIIALGFTAAQEYYSKAFLVIAKGLMTVCLLCNIGVFTVKAAVIVTSKDERNPYSVAEWFKKNVPAGSKVAGDYTYYYAAIENGCEYRRITREKTDLGLVFSDLKDNFQPDYIVLSYETAYLYEKPEFSIFNTELVSSYEMKENAITQQTQMLVQRKIASSYSGSIYKVKK